MPLTAGDVRQVTFSTAIRGYALDEVDDFLDLLAAALDDLERGRTPRLSGVEVERHVFRTSLRGYDLGEVDDFLDEAVATLSGTGQDVATPRPSSPPTIVAGTSLRADHPVPVEGPGAGWLRFGVALLALSGLIWALTAAILIDEPTDIGATLIEAAVLTAVPLFIGLWAVRRGRWTNARRAHTIPRLWMRIGQRVLLLGTGFAAASMFLGNDEASVGVLFAVIGVATWAIAGLLRRRQRQSFRPTIPMMIGDVALTPYSAGLLEMRVRLANTGGESLRDPVVEPFRYRREWVVVSGLQPAAAELRRGTEVSHRATIGPVNDPELWGKSIEEGSWGLLASYSDDSGQRWEQLFYP